MNQTKVFTHLKKFRPDVMYLQETQLRLSEQVKLKKPWMGQIFGSKNDNRTQEVAILIRKGTPFVQTSITSDARGRFIIVKGSLYGKLVT